MLPIDATHDFAHCGGPRRCHYCAEILNEAPERGCGRRTAEDRTRGLRTAERHDYAPPDPWAAGIAAQRTRDAKAAAARTYQPPLRPTTAPVDVNGIPDPYAAGLAAMKEDR